MSKYRRRWRALHISVLLVAGACGENDEPTVMVPPVSGISVDLAKDFLAQNGLAADVKVTGTPKCPLTVTGQNPESDAIVNRGAVVTLETKPVCIVPNVLGQQLSQATTTLSESGLKGSPTNDPPPVCAPVVTTQNPNSGETVDEGAAVTIVIRQSRSPNECIAPHAPDVTTTTTPTPMQ